MSKDGWTSHGHPIPGVTVYGDRPRTIARCGGPALCDQCLTEAGAAQAQARRAAEAMS